MVRKDFFKFAGVGRALWKSNIQCPNRSPQTVRLGRIDLRKSGCQCLTQYGTGRGFVAEVREEAGRQGGFRESCGEEAGDGAGTGVADRGDSFGEGGGPGGEFLPGEGRQKFLFGGEVEVKRSFGDARGSGDRVHAEGGDALLDAEAMGCLKNAAGFCFAHSLPTISELCRGNSVDNELQLI